MRLHPQFPSASGVAVLNHNLFLPVTQSSRSAVSVLWQIAIRFADRLSKALVVTPRRGFQPDIDSCYVWMVAILLIALDTIGDVRVTNLQ